MEDAVEQGGHFLRAVDSFVAGCREFAQGKFRPRRGAFPTGIELGLHRLAADVAGPTGVGLDRRHAPGAIQFMRRPKVLIALDPEFGVKRSGT